MSTHKTTAAHTPTPWRVESLGQNNFRIISEPAAKGLAMTALWVADLPNYADHSKADAAFIVRAANAHAALVAALENALPWFLDMAEGQSFSPATAQLIADKIKLALSEVEGGK
jgi:hypothetical protein